MVQGIEPRQVHGALRLSSVLVFGVHGAWYIVCGVIVCYFCVCVLAWPSLAPCEGRVKALCELFCEHHLWHNLLGESGWP